LTINIQNLEQIQSELIHYSKTKLLIVTKNQSFQDIKILLEKGYFFFGENRVQEASLKFTENLRIQFPNLQLNLIGPLQSNKAKQALMLFDTIQSLDRKKIIDEISVIKKKIGQVRTKYFFLQVNIGMEQQKSGIPPHEASHLYDYAIKSNLNIIGLMCIPPYDNQSEKYFKDMKNLRDQINPKLLLSMGMSSDYHKALLYSSNCIRIGSKIFQ
jgi:pyridoxal phosphate enzyme (YggS family)